MAKRKGMAKLGAGKKIMVLALIVILIIIAYYMLVYREKASKLKQLRGQYKQLVVEEQDWEKRQKTYIQDVEDLNRRKERQREQTRILPPDAEMSSFLMDLDNLAGLAGLEIELLEPHDEEGAGFYARIPVGMKVEGKFHQILKFFYSIARLERIINIQNIRFKYSVDKGTEVNIISDVEATTFRSLEKPTAPGGGA